MVSTRKMSRRRSSRNKRNSSLQLNQTETKKRARVSRRSNGDLKYIPINKVHRMMKKFCARRRISKTASFGVSYLIEMIAQDLIKLSVKVLMNENNPKATISQKHLVEGIQSNVNCRNGIHRAISDQNIKQQIASINSEINKATAHGKVSRGRKSGRKASTGRVARRKASSGRSTRRKASPGRVVRRKASRARTTRRKASPGRIVRRKASRARATSRKASRRRASRGRSRSSGKQGASTRSASRASQKSLAPRSRSRTRSRSNSPDSPNPSPEENALENEEMMETQQDM